MKQIAYKSLLCISFFMALLSTYCKVLVSQLDILNKSGVEVIISFLGGILFSFFMLFLLHHLIQRR